MFVSYRWLQEYVDIKDVTAQELADKITKSGIEVEGVEVLNKGVKGVVVGHVLECEFHKVIGRRSSIFHRVKACQALK